MKQVMVTAYNDIMCEGCTRLHTAIIFEEKTTRIFTTLGNTKTVEALLSVQEQDTKIDVIRLESELSLVGALFDGMKNLEDDTNIYIPNLTNFIGSIEQSIHKYNTNLDPYLAGNGATIRFEMNDVTGEGKNKMYLKTSLKNHIIDLDSAVKAHNAFTNIGKSNDEKTATTQEILEGAPFISYSEFIKQEFVPMNMDRTMETISALLASNDMCKLSEVHNITQYFLIAKQVTTGKLEYLNAYKESEEIDVVNNAAVNLGNRYKSVISKNDKFEILHINVVF